MKNLRQIILEELKKIVNEGVTASEFSVVNNKLTIANKPTKISVTTTFGKTFDDLAVVSAVKNSDGSANIVVKSGPITKDAHFKPEKVQAIIASVSTGKPFSDESFLGTLSIVPV